VQFAGGTTGGVTHTETDWVLGQFGSERSEASAQYAAFVAEGIGQANLWEGLRHQIFLGSESFVKRFTEDARPVERLREVPRAQRRALAKPLGWFEKTSPVRREAMARSFLCGVYTMKEVADHFDVHYSTVSRAVRWLEEQREPHCPETRDCRVEVRRAHG
jgi:hypothetical protein